MASDINSERGKPLPPHGLVFPISSKDYSIFTTPTDKIAHTTAFVTRFGWVHHEGWTRRPIAPRAYVLTTEIHLALSQICDFINEYGELNDISEFRKRMGTTGNIFVLHSLSTHFVNTHVVVDS